MSKKSEEALNALIKPIRKWLAVRGCRVDIEPLSNHSRDIIVT